MSGAIGNADFDGKRFILQKLFLLEDQLKVDLGRNRENDQKRTSHRDQARYH